MEVWKFVRNLIKMSKVSSTVHLGILCFQLMECIFKCCPKPKNYLKHTTRKQIEEKYFLLNKYKKGTNMQSLYLTVKLGVSYFETCKYTVELKDNITSHSHLLGPSEWKTFG